MTTDLFPHIINKSKQLLSWCREKRIFSKADILRYALEKYYIRSDRTIKDFVKQGLVKRLTDREKEQRSLTGKMAYYMFLG